MVRLHLYFGPARGQDNNQYIYTYVVRLSINNKTPSCVQSICCELSNLLYLPTVLHPRELMEPILSMRRPKQPEDFLGGSLRTLFRFFAVKYSLIAVSSRPGWGCPSAASSTPRLPTLSWLSHSAGTSVCTDSSSLWRSTCSTHTDTGWVKILTNV